MKLKQIALLVAGLTSAALANAAPVTQAEIESARVAGTLQQAWISGASAPTKSIYEGWVGAGTGVGCDSGTNTIFTNATAASNVPGALGNFTAYACKRAGKVSVLYHTVDGGSLNAYTPHTVGTKLARLKYVGTAANCTGTPGSYTDASNTDNNATVIKGCSLAGAAIVFGSNGLPTNNAANATAVAADPNAPQLPVGGFSDVEAELFSSNIGGGDVAAFGTQGEASIGQVFGVVVSTPLYRALQTAQGLADVNSTTYDPVNAPNITRAQYIAIAGQGGSANGSWATILNGSNPGKVKVERRVNTSGTQASSNAYFFASPCASGANANLNPSGASDSGGNYLVTENSGTGNVKSRITSATNNATATEQYAIGVMSAENDWRLDSAANNGYRFVKVDGVHPESGDVTNARGAAAKGQYAFHMEMKNFVANTATGFGATIVGDITAALSNPPTTSCAVLPRGLTINPLAGSSCALGTEVAKVSNLGKNCSPAQVLAQ